MACYGTFRTGTQSNAMNRLLPAFVVLLLLVPTAQAQTTSQFTFSGQIRHRSALDGRDFNADTSPADVHLLRTRLNAAVDPVDRVEAFVQIQDSRRFGAGNADLARGTMDPSAGQLDVHQAYFVIRELFEMPLSIKVGRQELAYGNQRLVGSVGWSNVGRAFDAGVLAYDGERASVDLFAARLVGSPVEGDGSENLFGLYSSWQLGNRHALDVYALLDNNTNEILNRDGSRSDRMVRFTPGATLAGTVSSVSYTLEAALQTGKTTASPGAVRSTTDASMLSASASTAVGANGARLGAGYTRLSGDARPADDVRGQFNTLFATNHKFYGFMDYFPASASPYGLQDARIEATLPLSDQVNLAPALHHFVQAESAPSVGTKVLGQELDVTVTYKFADNVTFTTGVSGFRPDDAIKTQTGNDDISMWGYVMSVINF